MGVEPGEIDTTNDQMVGAQGLARVCVIMPSRSMTVGEAIRHAAWLVAMADAVEPGAAERFPVVLDAVRNT